jgi:hypothetical protein
MHTMPHLSPAHHETRKHDSPNQTKIKEKQNKTIPNLNSNLAKLMTHHNQIKELTTWFLNKARALGSKKWTNRMLMERLMMAYTPMNYNVVALIRQDPTYKKMTSDDVLGRIMNHEMNIQEANNIKNLYKGISTSKKQRIALKANKSKKKKVLIESPSEEEEEEKEEEDSEREYDEGKMALFIKNFNKFIKKRRPYKGERKK